MISALENGAVTFFSLLFPNELKKGIMIIAIAASVAAFALGFFSQSTFIMAGACSLGITGFLGFLAVEEAMRSLQLEADLVTVNKQVKILEDNERKEKESIQLFLNTERRSNILLQGGNVHIKALQKREQNLNAQLKESEKTNQDLQKEVSSLKESLDALEFGKRQLESNTQALERTLQELETEVSRSKELASQELAIFSSMRSKIKSLNEENISLRGDRPKRRWFCIR